MKLRVHHPERFGVLLLSLLSAVDWLVPDLLPHAGSKPFSEAMDQAILFSVLSIIASLITGARRLPFPRARRAWITALMGAGLFVVPAAAAGFANGAISRVDQVAVLCLTPLFAIVIEPYVYRSARMPGTGALRSAVVSVAGILCFFPLEAPGSWRAGLALMALLAAALGLAATNCFAVRSARSVPGQSTLPMAAIASGTTALCFLVAAILTPWTFHSDALPLYVGLLLVLRIPALLLLFWLFGHVAASRLTTTFLFTPLFVSLAGLALERMLPPLRSMAGLALLAGGAAWILFAPAESQDDEPISLGRIAAGS